MDDNRPTPDLAKTIEMIKQDGEHQQRLGDLAHRDGLNEKAETYYHRAKVAREEALLLWGTTEVGDAERCFELQANGLLVSADLYKLVRWELDDPDAEQAKAVL
jgi:hypothetical protein